MRTNVMKYPNYRYFVLKIDEFINRICFKKRKYHKFSGIKKKLRFAFQFFRQTDGG